MKHFLFVTFDGGGSLPPELGVARRVIERGHRVTVLGDDCSRDEVEASGARFVGYRMAPNRQSKHPDDAPVKDWTIANPLAGLKSMIVNQMCGPALEVAGDVLAIHDTDPADVIVGSMFVFGSIIAGEAAGIPVCVVMPNLDIRPNGGRPPVGPGLKPMRGPVGSLRDALVGAVARRTFVAGRPGLERARQELELPTLPHPLDEFGRADKVLLLTSRHFEYAGYKLDDRTIFAGPVLDDPSWAPRWRSPWPIDDERPLALVTLGSTFQDQRDLYRRIVEALAGKHLRAVVTVGNVFETNDFHAPDNVDLVASAAHDTILDQASVAIVHGGHGSVVKALAKGVPLLVIPIGRDQPDNAARVEWHGAGLAIKSKSDATLIARAVDELLDNASYRSAAQRIGSNIRHEIATNDGIDELEALAGTPTNTIPA